MSIIMIIFSVLLGLFFGAIISTFAFRYTDSRKLFHKSSCSVCLEPIHPVDSIPVISYLKLKGRCRHCSSVIEWQYLAIELVSALLFAILTIKFLMNPDYLITIFIRDITLFALAVLVFVYDLRIRHVPDKITLSALTLIIILNLISGFSPEAILLGILACGGFFAIQYLASAGNMVGSAEVRLGAIIGASLGLIPGFITIVIAYLIAGLVGIFLILKEKADIHDSVPFGSFLSIALIIMLIFDTYIYQLYIKLIELL